MNVYFRNLVVLSLGIIVLFPACSPGTQEANTPEADNEIVSIVTTNYPLYYFTTRIAGDRATVHLPVERGQDPADWSPSAADITAMQQADLVILNGAGYESWIDKVTLNRKSLVDTSASLEDQWIAMDKTVTHTHGPESKHAHGTVASTTWLDIKLAAYQVENIYKALLTEYPEHESEFSENLRLLLKDLHALDAVMKEAGESLGGQALLASHPVYQYAARAYGLNIQSMHWEPGQEITRVQWLDFQKVHHDFPATVMLWEAEPLADTVSTLSAMNIEVVVFNPGGSFPESGDFLTVMHNNANRLKIP